MSPIQQMLLGAGGAVATKTYIDDIFSTYVYKATGSSGQQINNGIDLTDKGLVWFKGRSNAWSNALVDTVRGGTKLIYSDLKNDEGTFTDAITSFNNNGFTTGTNQFMNYASTHTYVSWSFKAVPGFMDVVTYTGDGQTSQQLSHGLSSIPGCIMVKNLDDDNEDWLVYHHSLGDATLDERYKALFLNRDTVQDESEGYWYGTNPTSAHFTVGSSSKANRNGDDYIAYVFAGGESTAATATSVALDGTGDYLDTDQNSNYSMGTGDFTVEGWFKETADTSNTGLFQSDDGGSTGLSTTINDFYTVWLQSDTFRFYAGGTEKNTGVKCAKGVWYHIALVRNSSKTTLYINGTATKTVNDTVDHTPNVWAFGGYYSTSYLMTGSISNIRIVKGTAVYTSSFKPPTEPLTSIANTKCLFCQGSSVTASTTSSTTIRANGNPTASTDSPFDDPAAFVFGENEDQGLIKCGSYIGNSEDTNGPEIFLGWEPQYVLAKRITGGTGSWLIFDSMRGIKSDQGGDDSRLYADTSAEEENQDYQYIDLTPTGFKVKTTGTMLNNNGDTYIYMAVAAETGETMRPVELATDVFAMDTGAGSATIPGFDSNFPVDFALVRTPSTGMSWEACARIMGGRNLMTDTNAEETTYGANDFTFDSNVGWLSDSGYDSTYQSWMWKRHAGFDVVSWPGRGGNQTGSTAHNLGVVPEMIWSKRRDGDPGDWIVYHEGLNGGTNPEQYYLNLNDNGAESQAQGAWNYVAPTATHFSTGVWSAAGAIGATDYMITMLFASVKGVSHCGSYDGSNSEQEITIPDGGFQPRFVIIKCSTAAESWLVLDTTRGWGSGDDKALLLNTNDAQGTDPYGAPTSTGFTVVGNFNIINQSGKKYIYYAHA